MALYRSIGTISDMSEVSTGTSLKGNTWQRMTLLLDIPGYQGTITKQVFQVFGDLVKDVSLFNHGDKVEVSWSMYAREWNGKWYNSVDLVSIKYQDGVTANPAPKAAPQAEVEVADNDNDLPF